MEVDERAGPANQNRWLIPLAVLLALFLCCSLAVCLAAGLLLVGTASWSSGNWEPSAAVNTSLSQALDRGAPTDAERNTAQLLRGTSIPSRDLLELAVRLEGSPDLRSRSSTSAPRHRELGDSEVFWLHDAESHIYFTSTATLESATSHAYWWVEEGYQVPAEDLERSAWHFENTTYPTCHRYFGSERTPGLDGDAHIYIVLADVPGVGGYFSGPDEYPSQITAHSNEHEMIYISLENAAPGEPYFDGIVAHEFQHMIHWAMDRDEDTWVNEGLSELASWLGGYDVGGSDLVFTQQPDTQLTAWSELEDSGPHYGASYLFLSYFLERYGDDAIPRLVWEPSNSIAGFEAVLRELDTDELSFDSLFADWVVANYLDEGTAPKDHYGYADLNLSRPTFAARHLHYPIRQEATVHQYAADYVSLEGQEAVTLEFTGSLRVPLLGNSTHSGEYQWWSNRGDESDTTLTRAFDLTGVPEATLEAWTWYDLETDYDYAYVEVSADGGVTWDLLANEHTTTADPSGNSYGPALTGCSGGGERPVWVQQSYDLTPHTGGPVLVRFEVITDEAVNHPGFAVDDISLPQLGYHYDTEQGDGGWQAEGWLRVTDHIPQAFTVQVITQGWEDRVERMVLDEEMHGRLNIGGPESGIQRAVVVISALAPVTTEPAAYRYQVRSD